MTEFIEKIVINIPDFFREISLNVWGFILSNLLWFKLFSALLSAIFIGLIFYLNVKLNLTGEKIEHWVDIIGASRLTKRRSFKAWKQIKRRLGSNNQNDLKLAVLEADRVLDELLKLAGVMGNTIDERLSIVESNQLTVIDDIRDVHKVKHRILSEPDFALSVEQARQIVDVYEKAFREFGLL